MDRIHTYIHVVVLTMVMSTMIFPITVFAFEDGADAQNAVGQLDASGDPSYTRGNANNAPRPSGLYSPNDTVVDESGHRLFVADNGNNRVLVFNLDTSNNLDDYTADAVLGQTDLISNVAGTSQSSLSGPWGMAYDSTNDRLFVADYNNNRIMVFDVAAITNGENAVNVLGQADFTSNGAALTQAGLNAPAGVAYDGTNDRLFVTDAGNNRVVVFDVAAITDGENAVNVLGQADFTSGFADTTQNTLSQPYLSAYDSTNDRLFVGDTSNNRVMVFDVAAITDGENAVNVLGQVDFTSSGFDTTQNTFSNSGIVGITYDSTNDRLFVSDGYSNRVMVFNVAAITNGENAVNVLGQADFTSSGSATTQSTFNYPMGVSYNATNSQLFVGDATNNRVMVFDVTAITNGENAVDLVGQTNEAITSPVYTTSDVQNGIFGNGISGPQDIALDTAGHRLFVADTTNNRVLMFNLDTSNNLVDYDADKVLGQSNFRLHAAGTTQSALSSPGGLAYDSTNDRLFVADYNNSRVMVFDVSAITNGENAVNVLGQVDFTSSGAGTTQSTLNSPTYVNYDSTNDRLFVADYNNSRVMVFDVAAITDGENAVNVLGQTDFTSSGSGTTQSTLSYPYGVSYDSTNDRLFVVDTSNNRVMVFDVAAITDGENAVNVLGQADFTSSGFNTTQARLSAPTDVAYDSTNDRIFVSEQSNSRVMVFDVAAITDGENAVNVLGQTDFTSSGSATTQSNFVIPFGVNYNSTNDTLWVTDQYSNRATEYDVSPSGGGGGGEGVPEFSDYLYMITLAACGWYVFTRLQKHQPMGGGGLAAS